MIIGSISKGLGISNDGGKFLIVKGQSDLLSIIAIGMYYFLILCVYGKTKRTKNTKTRKRELICKSKRPRRLTLVLPSQA
jgi:hypothetical protein